MPTNCGTIATSGGYKLPRAPGHFHTTRKSPQQRHVEGTCGCDQLTDEQRAALEAHNTRIAELGGDAGKDGQTA